MEVAEGAISIANPMREGTDITLFINLWLSDQEIRWAKSSYQAYKYAIMRFVAYREQQKRPPLTALLIKQYIRDLNWKQCSPAYIQHQLSVLRAFFKWAIKQKWMNEDPSEDIPFPKLSHEYRRERLSKEEAAHLVATVHLDTVDIRDRLLINLILRTGIRLIEAHRATVGDYVRKGKEGLLYIHGKGRRTTDNFAILVSDMADQLDQYLQSLGFPHAETPLFIGYKNNPLTVRQINQIITNHLKLAGLKRKRVTGYSLRHTAASLALENGADIIAVQQMLRHKSISTTQRYLIMNRRIEHGAEHFIQIPTVV